MILILRGHIRNSFDNLDLFEFVKCLYNINKNMKIYIHTWNIYANNISWRIIESNNTIVTKEKIYEYFGEFKNLIEEILIDDDKNINLVGKTEGLIHECGFMPLIGWKNYWYGKYRIIDHIFKNLHIKKIDINETIINSRIDLLSNPNSKKEEIINFIEKNNETHVSRNVFLRENEFFGVDNIYIGNIYTMHKLANYFNHYLDDILKKHNDTVHQEFIVYRVNNEIFT
jgi:hypothetical protein